MQFEHTIWMGDLNYRVDLELPAIAAAASGSDASSSAAFNSAKHEERLLDKKRRVEHARRVRQPPPSTTLHHPPNHPSITPHRPPPPFHHLPSPSITFQVRQLVAASSWAELQAADQLQIARRLGHAFVGFDEAGPLV